MPLIVHTRAADSETIEILQNEMKRGKFAGLIHCFSTSRELPEKAIDLGLYISLSGIITFKNAEELRSVIKNVPLSSVLIETDSPFLAPAPMRGKENEPSYIIYTLKKLAELKKKVMKERVFEEFKCGSSESPVAGSSSASLDDTIVDPVCEIKKVA